MEPNHPTIIPGFETLPTELIFEFAAHVKSLGDLASLARVNRTFHQIFDPILYQRDAAYSRQNGSRAVMWGAERNIVSLIERARLAGADISAPFRQGRPHHRTGAGHSTSATTTTTNNKPLRSTVQSRQQGRSFLDGNSNSNSVSGRRGAGGIDYWSLDNYWWHAVDVAARYNNFDVLHYLANSNSNKPWVHLGRNAGSRGLCGGVQENCLLERTVLPPLLIPLPIPLPYVRPGNDDSPPRMSSSRRNEWPCHDPVQVARCSGHEEMAQLIEKLRMDEINRKEAQIELEPWEREESLRMDDDMSVFNYRNFVLEV